MTKYKYSSDDYGDINVVVKNICKHIYIAAAFDCDNQVINKLRFTYQPSLEEIIILFEL